MNLNPVKTMTDRMTGSYPFSDKAFRVVVILLMALRFQNLDAQQATMVGILPSENEVVENISAGVGFSSALDEYLSPITYSGFSVEAKEDRMTGRGEGQLFRYSHNRSSLSFSDMKNSPRNGSQLEMAGNIVHVWEIPLLHYRSYDLLCGPSAGGGVDVMYNLRNSNNPANVHGWMAVGLGADSMFRFRAGRIPLALEAFLSLPVAGIFFVPDYNLPYYMIFEDGLYGKALHFMNPFNVILLNQDVALSVPVGRNQLSVSMSFDFMAHKLGGNNAEISHAVFGIGYVHRFERKYNGR